MNDPNASKYLAILMGCVTLLWRVRRVYGDDRQRVYSPAELNAMFDEGIKQYAIVKQTGIDNRKLLSTIDAYRAEKGLPPRVKKSNSRTKESRMRMAVARQMVLSWDGKGDIVMTMVSKLRINKRTAQRLVKDVKVGL